MSSNDESNEYCGAIYEDIEILDEPITIKDNADWKDTTKKERQLISEITPEAELGQTSTTDNKRKRIDKLPKNNAYLWKLIGRQATLDQGHCLRLHITKLLRVPEGRK